MPNPGGKVHTPCLFDYWAVARYDLRLTDAEFYDLTPRQFSKLFARHLESRRHTELLHGYTTAAVINTSDYRPNEPIPPARFMPSLFDHRPEQPKLPRRTRAQIADSIRNTMRGLVAATNRN